MDENKLQKFHESLNQIIKIKIRFLNIKQVLDASLGFILDRVDAPMGVINLSDNVYVQGIKQAAETSISIGLKIDGEGFTNVIAVEDWRGENTPFENLSIMMNSLNIRSSIITPIKVEDIKVGYLCIASPNIRQWRDDEVAMVDIAGERMGKILNESQESQMARMLPSYIQEFDKVSGTFSRVFSFDEALTQIGQEAVRLFDADHAVILLKDPGDSFYLSWIYELSETGLDQVLSIEEREITSYILTFMRPVMIPDIRHSGIPSQLVKFLKEVGIKYFILIPLIFEESVIGTILLLYSTPDVMISNEQEILSCYANLAAITLQNAFMHNQLESGYMEIALTLSDVMDERETRGTGTTIQVANLAEDIARSLGCTKEELDEIRWAALLHNIGKSEIPGDILSKPGPLSDEEWQIVYQHPEKAEERVRPIYRLKNVGSIIRNCRERYDGEGYPDHLLGEEIPLGSRVIAVADAYSSMIHDRPYRLARSHSEAISELQRYSGTQFDPRVVEKFVNVIDSESIAF